MREAATVLFSLLITLLERFEQSTWSDDGWAHCAAPMQPNQYKISIENASSVWCGRNGAGQSRFRRRFDDGLRCGAMCGNGDSETCERYDVWKEMLTELWFALTLYPHTVFKLPNGTRCGHYFVSTTAGRQRTQKFKRNKAMSHPTLKLIARRMAKTCLEILVSSLGLRSRCALHTLRVSFGAIFCALLLPHTKTI